MTLEQFLSFLAGVAFGSVAITATIGYMQRRNITMPTPEQAAEIVQHIVWAINAAQTIYGGGDARAAQAETLAANALLLAGVKLPVPLLRVAIRLLYYAIKPDLPPPAGNEMD